MEKKVADTLILKPIHDQERIFRYGMDNDGELNVCGFGLKRYYHAILPFKLEMHYMNFYNEMKGLLLDV